MRTNSISVNNYNSPSFGIKRANTKEYRKVMETLAALNPEVKKEFDSALDKFCNVTQQGGIKGTFTPTKINDVNGYTILEYRIDGLHANGDINPHKMSKFKRGQIYVENCPKQKPNRKPNDTRYSKIIDKVTLVYKYAGNGESDGFYLSLLGGVLKKFNIEAGHCIGYGSGQQRVISGSNRDINRKRYLNHQNSCKR